MVWPAHWKSVLVISLVSLLLYPAVARADVPTSYITEVSGADYNTDGSLVSPVVCLGYVEVEVPNQLDVLQYLVLELSGTANTNLQSTLTYRGVAASPSPGDRTRLYVNTTSSESNISYNITGGVMPVIYLGMEYANDAGGRDIYSGGTNSFSFDLTINSTHDLNGVSVYLRFARNTLGLNDSIHLYGVSPTSGNSDSWDSDGDGFFDMLSWTGPLSAGVDVEIYFRGYITPDVNFNENFMYVDLDQETTSQATHTSTGTSTPTGISFVDRFSRGPVRVGVDMLTMDTWIVRGFIRNMALGLDYRIHGWGLYQIGQGSPVISSSEEIYPFNPGETKYTDWYDTGLPGMQDKGGYYSTSWDWEVVWGSSYYSSMSQATISLPVLYEIDAWVDKSVVVGYSTESGTGLSVQDLARHIGHSGLSVGSVSIGSVIPHQSAGGTSNNWAPSDVRVFYINASGQTEITTQVSIMTQAATTLNDGFVNVSINNLTSLLGHGLQQNEDIRLEYDVAGGSHASTHTYQFCQTSTLVTLSGTPVTKNVCQDVVIPGVGGEPEPGGPGGGPVEPAMYADIAREMGEGYFIADNLVRVLARYNIIDTGNKGVKDIKAVIYIPEYGSLDISSLSFRIYENSSGKWIEWNPGNDYKMTDNGMTLVNGRRHREYLITKITSGGLLEESLNLFNGDKIEISYKTTVPVGTSFLITRVFGYNYYEDKYIFEDMYIPVRREGILQDLEVVDGGWQVEGVRVGVPVRWTKGLTVHNPNSVSVEHLMRLEVFPDTLSAHVIREGGDRESLALKEGETTHVDITFRLKSGETKTYVLEAVTPPVLETKRVVNVLESGEREIRFVVNTTVENFALEVYSGVSLLFKSGTGNVVYVMEGENLLNYSEYDNSTTEIFLGRMEAGRKRELTIVYTEVPPILLTAMGAVMHGCSDYANITVFVIPSERETGSYLEIEVVGPSPHLKTMNAQLVEMKDVWPWEEVRLPFSVDLRSFSDGKYSVYSRFKKDFQTILTDHSDFYVNCPERTIVSLSWMVFLAVALAAIGYLLFRFWRRKRPEGIGELKRKLRELR